MFAAVHHIVLCISLAGIYMSIIRQAQRYCGEYTCTFLNGHNYIIIQLLHTELLWLSTHSTQPSVMAHIISIISYTFL